MSMRLCPPCMVTSSGLPEVRGSGLFYRILKVMWADLGVGHGCSRKWAGYPNPPASTYS